MNNIAIFVNSCDAFEDCWGPFFRLFVEFGYDLKGLPIYLNTERKEVSFDGLNIKCLKVADDVDRRLTWSECLIEGLKNIPEEYIVYFQEDYFLNSSVVMEQFSAAFEFLQKHGGDAVYLNSYGPIIKTQLESNSFSKVPRNSKYFLSTQVCIWRKSFLSSLILPWENGWMFEKFGGLRMKRVKGAGVYTVNPDCWDKANAVDYIYTGVMKGAWNRDCVSFFESRGVQVNFATRGFYKPRSKWQSKAEVLYKIAARPSLAWKSFVASLLWTDPGS